nr:MAG TPA: hypothetical protein [Caudoviricetes sp.]
MPEGLKFPDMVMYQALAALYGRYRMKTITRDRASFEKKALLSEYEALNFKWSLGDRWAQLLKQTEAARCAYRKERTLENADKLLHAIDGINT